MTTPAEYAEQILVGAERAAWRVYLDSCRSAPAPYYAEHEERAWRVLRQTQAILAHKRALLKVDEFLARSVAA